MPKQANGQPCEPIAAQCAADRRRFAIDISDLTPDGCSASAPEDWNLADDFLELTIGESVDIKGRLEWCEGCMARIRFFGQLHPVAVERLSQLVH